MDKKTANESTTPAPMAAPKYKLKPLNGGAKSVKHPVLGVITDVHLQGPRSDAFIKAIKGCDARKETNGFFERFIEEGK